ncbi:DUF3789 domain-containing protein [Enterococcus casseliflavus]
MSVLTGFLLFFLGSLLGISIMCLLQVSSKSDAEYMLSHICQKDDIYNEIKS